MSIVSSLALNNATIPSAVFLEWAVLVELSICQLRNRCALPAPGFREPSTRVRLAWRIRLFTFARSVIDLARPGHRADDLEGRAGLQYPGELLRDQRPAEIVPLGFTTAFGLKERELVACFDAFRNHP